jgi:hypothetical protein
MQCNHSRMDLDYIHRSEAIRGKSSVTWSDYDQFWGWFGDAIHRVRHDKKIGTLWQSG